MIILPSVRRSPVTNLDNVCACLKKSGIPFVQLGYDTEHPAYDAVVIDSCAGIRYAVGYLIRKGHTKIGLVRWVAEIARINSNKKLAGYRSALAEASLPWDASLVGEIRLHTEGEYHAAARATVERLAKAPCGATAVVVDNSFVSPSLLYPCPDDNGIMPQWLRDLEIVHFEDWPLDPVEDVMRMKLRYPRRETTLLAIDWPSIGRIAAELLIERLRNRGGHAARNIGIRPDLETVSGWKRAAVDISGFDVSAPPYFSE